MPDQYSPYTDGMQTATRVTLIKSTDPDRVCKRYTDGPDGLAKSVVANVKRGEATSHPATNAAEMAAIVARLCKSRDLVLVTGEWHNDPGKPFEVLSEGELCQIIGGEKGEVAGGVITHGDRLISARLKRGITPAAWVLFDADNPPGIPQEWAAMTIAERMRMWDKILPGLSACERIEWRGSSARVINGSGSKPKTHALVRVNQPDRIPLMKAWVGVEMVNQGLSFKFEKRSKVDRTKVVGIEARSVFDLAVFDTGRLIFVAEPDVQANGYHVDDPGIEIVNPGGGVLDISKIKIPNSKTLREYKQKTNIELDIKASAGGGLSITSYGQLTDQTEITADGVVKTLAQWAVRMSPGAKLRCESPFRESYSEAAFIRITELGEVLVHDVGNGVTYKKDGFAIAADAVVDNADDGEPPPPVARNPGKRVTIIYEPQNLAAMADKAEAALINAGVKIYRRGANLVRPEVLSASGFHGRVTHQPTLRPANLPMVLDNLSRCTLFARINEQRKAVPILPPDKVANLILSRQDSWQFPPVSGVITAPTLRPDGSILATIGYDAATKLYLAAVPAMPPVPRILTKDDAEAAMCLLEGLLTEFPFVSDESRSVAISGILTTVCRGAFAVAPLHAADAPTPGSGKSYLIDVIASISTGNLAAVVSWSKNPEENEKRLDGALLNGSPIVAIDNISGAFGGDKICTTVERPFVSVRRLGGSDQFEIENRATVFATGNNLVFSGDITRRALLIRLDPQVERPELRVFNARPTDLVFANQGRYISAALTVVSAYIAAGSPARPAPLASFEGWSDTVRAAIMWLGRPDPVGSMLKVISEDPERQARNELVEAWAEDLGGAWYTAEELIAAAGRKAAGQTAFQTSDDWLYPRFRDAALEVAGDGRGNVIKEKLAYWLRSHRDQFIAGRQLTKQDGRKTKWSVARKMVRV